MNLLVPKQYLNVHPKPRRTGAFSKGREMMTGREGLRRNTETIWRVTFLSSPNEPFYLVKSETPWRHSNQVEALADVLKVKANQISFHGLSMEWDAQAHFRYSSSALLRAWPSGCQCPPSSPLLPEGNPLDHRASSALS